MKRSYFSYFFALIFFCIGTTNVLASSVPTPIPSKTMSYQVPILVYHSFGSAMQKRENGNQFHYRVTAGAFEDQMKYLADNGYHPVSFAVYVNSLKNGIALPAKAMVLTFDDGWKTQYQYAVPILEKYHFTGTFFIVTKTRGGAFMTWDNLKDLVAHGFDIESHTETHPILTKVSSTQLIQEVVGSKKTLESKLGIKVTTIAYPNYMHNVNVETAVQSAEYIGARGGWAKFQNSASHIYELASQEAVNNPNPFSSKRLPD